MSARAEVPTADRPIVVLAAEACWTLLASQPVGRLAYRLVDEVHVVPVNYVVDHTRPAGPTLLVLTAAGNKLLAAELGSEVALQIDHWGGRRAWSVLVRGTLQHLGDGEERRADELGLRPWVPGLRYDVVELTPRAVTGRRFRLDRR